MIKILIFLFLCASLLHADDRSIENIFKEYAIEGTFILTDLTNDTFYIHNSPRADKRFPAASTFKIPHTLIALSENIVSSEHNLIKWDGIKREYDAWNKDQTLSSAMAVSCVWCYKRFSKKISKEKYTDYLSKFNYGNKNIGKDKSSFWLDGSLKISAYEQIEFLKKVYKEQLPISKKYIDIVKKIMSVEEGDNYILRAKTGWNAQENIGWYVGYIESQNDVYFFSMNGVFIKEKLNLRKEIVHKILEYKKIK